MKKVIKNEKIKPPLPVLSPGILCENFVFVLGMAGLDKNRKPISKDIGIQTVRTMERIEEVLKAEDLSFKNVVRARFSLTDVKDFEAVNNTYRKITGEDLPACTFMQVKRNPILGEDVKIQMIAYKGEKRPVQTDKAPALLPGCPQAIAVGDFLFVQGMNGVDVNSGRIVGRGIAEQTAKAIENISEVLKVENLTLENLVKASIFLTDLKETNKAEEVYRKYIDFLAPSIFEVPRISERDEKIKIEVIASKKIGKRLIVKKAPVSFPGMAQGISIGGFVFVHGMGGIDATTGNLASKDIVKQTEMTLKNLEEVLKEDGMTLEDAVDASIFVTDMNQYPVINETYAKYMGEQPPARICVEISRMPSGCDIMIEVIAAH